MILEDATYEAFEHYLSELTPKRGFWQALLMKMLTLLEAAEESKAKKGRAK